jgi:CDGSH-type Zn-finger protein
MSENEKRKPRIKIIKDGPYLVTGNVPLGEKIIVSGKNGKEFVDGRQFPQAQTYALCRCGHSKTPPFCDGSHMKAHFDGTETASRLQYIDRADLLEGITIDLMDDNRCAYARFCHGKGGKSTWELTAKSYNEENREEAIRTASNCPTGRLTAVQKNGQAIEPQYEPSIEILQDPEEEASSGIFVKGGVELESADGTLYETRNRYVLCRCGESSNKPFCDASHISIGYSDEEKK